jgi:hypothetical protein
MIDDLRGRIEGEEFDYQTLLDSLKQYERPRDKITRLLRKREKRDKCQASRTTLEVRYNSGSWIADMR